MPPVDSVWDLNERYRLSVVWVPDPRFRARVRTGLIVLWLALAGGVDLGESEFLPRGTYLIQLLDVETTEIVQQILSRWTPAVEGDVDRLLQRLKGLSAAEINQRYFSGQALSEAQLLFPPAR